MTPRGAASPITKRIDVPTAGKYSCRLFKGGPRLAARVFWSTATDPDTGERLDRSPVLLCMVAGDLVNIENIWPSLWPVDDATYAKLVRETPANPRQRVDLTAAPPIF